MVWNTQIAYDNKHKKGYFEWVSNLISREELIGDKVIFHFRIPKARAVSPVCWTTIHDEMCEFHREFSSALRFKREILPLVSDLSTLLRHLCFSMLPDSNNRDGFILKNTTRAWAHVAVIRRLDEISCNVEPGTVASNIIGAFRASYFATCDRIFFEFAKLCEPNAFGWIAMKKDDERTQAELTAMLSECVSGLLRHASPRDQT